MKKKNGPKWPHDHASKHAEAARLGWERRRQKFGGGAEHTEKLRYLKPRKPKAPKKAAPSVPTSKPAEDTFRYVATQKANGKWIVSKYYKSGRIKQEPGEYVKNPLPGRHRDGAKPRDNRDAGGLFGGSYEREKTYGSGLFG